MKLRSRFLVSFLVCPITIWGQTLVNYKAFDGTIYKLYAFEGRNIVLLSETSNRDPLVIKKILARLDLAYDDYHDALGRDPLPNTLFPKHTIVAEVKKNLSSSKSTQEAAGLGQVGQRIIQVGTKYFEAMINSMAKEKKIDHLVYYELGRNFWFMNSKLEFNELWLKTGGKGRGSGQFMLHGFPIFMERYIAWSRNIEFSGSGAGSLGFDEGINTWLDGYLDNDSLTFENTMLDFDRSLYTFPKTGQKFGTMDFFAAILLKVTKGFGGRDFVNQIWKKVLKRPDFETVQDALDNLVIAASEAAGYNLVEVFDDYKWPTSDEAVEYLESNFDYPDS